LVLDEIYSFQWRGGRPRLKHSFGTALKLVGPSAWANLSTYAKLAILTAVIFFEPQWSQTVAQPGNPASVQQCAARFIDSMLHR
jgi:hypothetical protein